ncbi:bifunctional diguanylate cyclase/phosphodiesterase [Luteimonas qiangzhengi]|uniref:bifunctional diguanylate cyclase/phosphodiesterase n=1 Tax=Luteimonas sp. MJ146 TaxID=3129240 RepID=UPI0031BA01B1
MPQAGLDFGKARRRRAWTAGCMLFAGLLTAAALLAWGDLEVRQRAGQRYVQALADSHAREVGHELTAVEGEFRALADSLEAIGDTSPEAVPLLLRDSLAGIVRRNPALAGLRLESGAPEFVSVGTAIPAGTAEPRRLHLGQSAPDADETWRLPVALQIPGHADGSARWLRAELDVDVFSSVLRVHEVGPSGVASVLGHDGTLLARSDSGVLHAGLQAGYSPAIAALRQVPGGVVRSESRLDGVVRVVGFRTVRDRPLVATVGIPPGVLHAGWWPFVFTLALGVVLLMAAWGAGLHFMRRASLREHGLRERVRDAETQYRFLYEQHPLPAVVYDRETMRVLEVNAAAELQYGYTHEAFLALGLSQLLADGATEDDVRDEVRNFPQAYGRRIWPHLRADGIPFSGLVFAQDIASFDGRPARLMLVLDVTEQVRAEADLRLLRRAVESSREGVFIVDAARRQLVYGNEAFMHLGAIGRSSRGLSARQVAVDTIADDEVRTILRDALDREQAVSVEAAGPATLEGDHWREIRLSPVHDSDGAVTHFVGLLTDITARRLAAREVAWRASHDALTGLVNRDALISAIDDAIAAATGQGDGARVSGIALCVINLDGFKLINDSLGTSVGDEVLVMQARRLEEAAIDGEVVARLGGDEFGVLLNGPAGAQVAGRAGMLRTAVSRPVPVRGIELLVTASLGYACYPGDGDSGAELLRAASRAVYEAKREGRNRKVAYHSGLDPRAAERLVLVQELHRALQEEQFELEFQLKFDVWSKPSGMEALVRWRHPERGLLGPGAFMDACEDSGLVVQLGSWVLEQAARCWRRLEELGHGHLRMAVNVSALQVREALVDEVAAVMARYALPPGVLELELTESVLLVSPETAARIMQPLSALGASISIDDFGTGYSSMAYLQHLPLQRLKLDKSFVRDLDSGTDGQAICYAILGMAQALGLGVTAEGVETPAQHEWLRARGCDEFQGYLLAKPMPFETLVARLS